MEPEHLELRVRELMSRRELLPVGARRVDVETVSGNCAPSGETGTAVAIPRCPRRPSEAQTGFGARLRVITRRK